VNDNCKGEPGKSAGERKPQEDCWRMKTTEDHETGKRVGECKLQKTDKIIGERKL